MESARRFAERVHNSTSSDCEALSGARRPAPVPETRCEASGVAVPPVVRFPSALGAPLRAADLPWSCRHSCEHAAGRRRSALLHRLRQHSVGHAAGGSGQH